MCKFIAYMGQHQLLLSDVIQLPANSLVNQTQCVGAAESELNTDGFGVGWYNHRVDGLPGIYKSVHRAWNDYNLKHLLEKLLASCFIAHIRAATEGDVMMHNCHPFASQNMLFAHHGSIRGFSKIKRKLREKLSDKAYSEILGHTDSEHFFALLNDCLPLGVTTYHVTQLSGAVAEALAVIASMREELSLSEHTTLNCAFTDGVNMVATRFSSDSCRPSPPLYYAFRSVDAPADGVIIASDPLTDLIPSWHEIPDNHMVLLDPALNLSLQPIDV